MTPIHLDLGGALAAFGLIFAVYQLRKESWDIVLRIRSGWQRRLWWILGVTGLSLALIGVLLADAPSGCCWIIPREFALTFQIAAYVCFIASPLSLLYLTSTFRRLFKRATAKRFYDTMVQAISQTNEHMANAALNVLLSNLETICKTAMERTKDEATTQYARAILDVIPSDELVVRILTTKRLDALQYIFAVIKEIGLDQSVAGIGVSRIVHNLFNDKESFLYKHLHQHGLALSSDLFGGIFGSPAILANFNLFGYRTLDYSFGKNLDVIGVEVYIAALSRSIETYLTADNVPARRINDGLLHLSEIFEQRCFRIREQQRADGAGLGNEDEWWQIHLIAKFLGHDYVFLADGAELDAVRSIEMTATKADFYSHTTINAGIAMAIYKAIEALSSVETGFRSYTTALDLLHGMTYEADRKTGYREPFERRLWEQIGVNVVRRWYPVPVRPYLEVIGFLLVANLQFREPWIAEQAERVRRLLYVDLKPLFDRGAEMINKRKMKDALLPEVLNYEHGRYTYTSGHGEGDRHEIRPPEKGAISALSGVDLESMPT